MPVELKQHFVAFLDLLGFKEMVAADIAGEKQQYLAKLFRCHQSAAVIFKDDPACTITQFSDSIVVSKPFDPGSFSWFVRHVAEFQRLLLDEGLLCRGGIAVNKHFSNGTFTFSAGLIDAYLIESSFARYPRVVVSPDVIDLLFPDREGIPASLVEEDDGLFFVDYIGVTKSRSPKKLIASVSAIVNGLLMSGKPSVKEKGLWLALYSDSILPTNLKRLKFSGRKIGLGDGGKNINK
ncbi:hypothetical protein [Burkholderia gladioli]|uniref:hypothetical protein n=1 Tax=Burkholderia gladioli TaxID=28095 RepID=UPI001641694F|nr:hypothetical protein [Burkholderia gladioli]